MVITGVSFMQGGYLHSPSGKVHVHVYKRSLESVVRISLYNRLQTPADSERIDRSSLNFQRVFPT